MIKHSHATVIVERECSRSTKQKIVSFIIACQLGVFDLHLMVVCVRCFQHTRNACKNGKIQLSPCLVHRILSFNNMLFGTNQLTVFTRMLLTREHTHTSKQQWAQTFNKRAHKKQLFPYFASHISLIARALSNVHGAIYIKRGRPFVWYRASGRLAAQLIAKVRKPFCAKSPKTIVCRPVHFPRQGNWERVRAAHIEKKTMEVEKRSLEKNEFSLLDGFFHVWSEIRSICRH